MTVLQPKQGPTDCRISFKLPIKGIKLELGFKHYCTECVIMLLEFKELIYIILRKSLKHLQIFLNF